MCTAFVFLYACEDCIILLVQCKLYTQRGRKEDGERGRSKSTRGGKGEDKEKDKSGRPWEYKQKSI